MARKRKPKTTAFKTVKRGCLVCDTRLVFKSELDLKRKKYCSLGCLGIANSRTTTSDLQKATIGLLNRGKKLSKETRKKLSLARTGQKATLKTREILRIAQKKRWAKHFEEHGRKETKPNLRGLAKYSHWRLQVHERDGFTCQQCGSIGGKIEAHHVLAYAKYPELRYDVDNGVTLCRKCHQKLHYKRKAV